MSCGSRVVCEFLAQGSAKVRFTFYAFKRLETIIKGLKPHVERMWIDDETQLVLFTARDVIDDTKLIIQTLVPEMTPPANTTRPARVAIASLAETDEIRTRTNQKTQEVREAEIHSGAKRGAHQVGQGQGWASSAGDWREQLVLAGIMLFAEGDKTAASQTLLRAAFADYPCEDSPHPIDLPHSSRLYKTLLQGGHFNRATSGMEKAPGWDASAFAAQFLDPVGKEVCVAMCTKGERNLNGAFVIAELCEGLKAGLGMGREGHRG
ncbi:hypothetical protein C8J57DRAFT_1243696 [Mycena rebaudengoi]|nr:hypothetical protein C8J57DRAFT_1243696 [Mycena rebaudengoi]